MGTYVTRPQEVQALQLVEDIQIETDDCIVSAGKGSWVVVHPDNTQEVLPDAEFQARYQRKAEFVPAPAAPVPNLWGTWPKVVNVPNLERFTSYCAAVDLAAGRDAIGLHAVSNAAPDTDVCARAREAIARADVFLAGVGYDPQRNPKRMHDQDFTGRTSA